MSTRDDNHKQNLIKSKMEFGMNRILRKPSVSSTLLLRQAATHATLTGFQTEEKLMSGLCTQFQSVWKPIVEKANCCNYTTIAVINVFFSEQPRFIILGSAY